MTGTVTDASGAVVAGATAKLVNVDTGVSFTATTNEAGQYRLLLRNPGNYTLTVELAGLASGSQYDALNVSGSATLGGALNVSFLGGFTPALGDSFDILTTASRIGTFATTNLPLATPTGCVAASLPTTGVRLLTLGGVGFSQQPQSLTACAGSTPCPCSARRVGVIILITSTCRWPAAKLRSVIMCTRSLWATRP